MLDHITWFWQSALRWAGDGPTVYVDPRGVSDDDPPADVLFVTHAHGDHFDLSDIEKVSSPSTRFRSALSSSLKRPVLAS